MSVQPNPIHQAMTIEDLGVAMEDAPDAANFPLLTSTTTNLTERVMTPRTMTNLKTVTSALKSTVLGKSWCQGQ